MRRTWKISVMVVSVRIATLDAIPTNCTQLLTQSHREDSPVDESNSAGGCWDESLIPHALKAQFIKAELESYNNPVWNAG